MKRILFPALLIVTLLAGILVALAIWRAPATFEEFLASGKQHFEQKSYAEATIQLLNAVQMDVRNREARYLLAMSYLNQQDLESAAKHLVTLLEYVPDDVEASLQLGSLFLTGGASDPAYFREASAIAERLLKMDPNNVAALVLSGNASAGLQDYSASIELFEKALSLDPQNSSAFVSLGTTRVLTGNYAAAEKAFLKAREMAPKSRAALISLANYYRAVQDPGKAETAFREALSVYPSDPAIYGPLAQLYYQIGRYDDAVMLLRQTQTNNLEDPRPSFILSDLYLARNQAAEARRVLRDLKKSLPDNLDLAGKLAVNLMTDDPALAQQEVDQILKAEPRNPVGLLLLGQLQYFSGQYEAAEAILKEQAALGSRFPETYFFLGNLAAKKGQTNLADDHYQRALTLNPGYLPARSAVAGLLLESGKSADARVEIRKVLEVDAKNVAARLLQVTADLVEKRYAEAETELAALLKEQPSIAEIHQQMAHYYRARGRAADAENSLLRAHDLKPDSPEILRELVQLYIQEKQTDKAVQRINAIPDSRKQALHYDLLGTVYAQAGRIQEAEIAFKAAGNDGDLATLYIQSGRVEEGLQKLDDVIKKDPTLGSAYAAKGMVYEKQGKLAQARESYSRALQVDPTLDYAANNLAYLLAEEGRDLETALTWAQSARRRQPEVPTIADTLGWVYYKRGNHLLARDQLLFAVSKQPDNPVFQYHLGLIYRETNQEREATAALRKAANSSTDFKEKSLAQAALKEIAN